MAFTKKEQSLLKDMQNEEKLCAEKIPPCSRKRP